MSHYPVTKLKLVGCHIGDTGVEVLAKDYSSEMATAHLLEHPRWNSLLLDYHI